MSRVQTALLPLARIADAYDADGLDETRPYWIANGVEAETDPDERELYAGRGGARLLTLGDCLRAREALRRLDAIRSTVASRSWASPSSPPGRSVTTSTWCTASSARRSRS